MMASINSIETFGLVDGPGIRTVVFFNGCKLRCKYCHNPDTWVRGEDNYTAKEIAERILRNKNYFVRGGGVTFSGGEPLLQSKFIIEVAKILKHYDIHIAIDTAGVGNGEYEELFEWIDLVILDIKHTDSVKYKELTGHDISDSLKFIEALNASEKDVWVRQVIVPGLTDNIEYISSLVDVVKNIRNVKKVEFLPYHRLGYEKYVKLGIDYPYKNIDEMDRDKCQELYKKFMEMYK